MTLMTTTTTTRRLMPVLAALLTAGALTTSGSATSPKFLIVTPGIRLTGSAMDDQERVMTPAHAIAAGANHIVIGRPITQADNPKAAAETFQHHIREARSGHAA